jgi:hypothetical protein
VGKSAVDSVPEPASSEAYLRTPAFRPACGISRHAQTAGLDVATVDAAFGFVAVSMFASGGLLWWFGEEPHPRLNPAA